MKAYLLERNGQKHIEHCTHVPEKYLAELTEDEAKEDASVLDVEVVRDKLGNEQRRVRINEKLRAELAEQQKRIEEARATEEKECAVRMERLRSIVWEKVDLESLKLIVKDLVDGICRK